LINFTFNTTADVGGVMLLSFLVFPAVFEVVGELPPTVELLVAKPLTAAKPMSLVR
jgi:hypothetical protein